MGTKNQPGRFDAMAKAEPDEPYFVLLARDPKASSLVRQWATERHAEGENGEVVMEALTVAAAMDKFAIEYHARPKAPMFSCDDER